MSIQTLSGSLGSTAAARRAQSGLFTRGLGARSLSATESSRYTSRRTAVFDGPAVKYAAASAASEESTSSSKAEETTLLSRVTSYVFSAGQFRTLQAQEPVSGRLVATFA